jgi:hypothetical protein
MKRANMQHEITARVSAVRILDHMPLYKVDVEYGEGNTWTLWKKYPDFTTLGQYALLESFI